MIRRTHNIVHWAITTCSTGSVPTYLYHWLDFSLDSGKDPYSFFFLRYFFISALFFFFLFFFFFFFFFFFINLKKKKKKKKKTYLP
jgi:phosphotransferase system  glucose/maltose/N-acetylglucosamine-specific IIC component